MGKVKHWDDKFFADTAHTWQPIETAPKDGRRLLLSDDEGVFIGHWAREIIDREVDLYVAARWETDGEGFTCHPYYWMELPKRRTSDGGTRT